MFLSSYLILSSVLSVLERVQSVRIESRLTDQEPLLLPLFGTPAALRIKVWYWQNDKPAAVKTFNSYLGIHRGPPAIRELSQSSGPKTMVFGSREYQNLGPGKPTSVLRFTDYQEPIISPHERMNSFSIASTSNGNMYLTRLLQQFDKKMVGIWWDSSSPLYNDQALNKVIGELAIGNSNPTRFVQGTEMRVPVEPPEFVTHHEVFWTPVAGTHIRVGNNPKVFAKQIIVDLAYPTVIPMDLYDAITKLVRNELIYTVGLLKGMPKDTNRQIMQYANIGNPIKEFDCKDASKLLHLRIGQLIIPPSMLYEKISDEKCKMTIQRNEMVGQQNVLRIGPEIIRRFYFSVHYDLNEGDYLEFAVRVEGEAPTAPVESSLLRNCCVS